MLTNATVDQLFQLNLNGMARALGEQLERADYQALTFEQRLGMLVDREAQDRENRRLSRYLKSAKLRLQASIEDINFRHRRGLDRATVLGLAESQWVEAHCSLLITGKTGLGKTYLACAFAQNAIRRGHTALYLRASRMLQDLVVARADGRLSRLLTAWSRVGVLVIDDLALQPLSSQQAADLLEVIEDRHQVRSTIVTSQLAIADWHASFGDPTIADAILDRLLQNAHRMELDGDSLRGPETAGMALAAAADETTTASNRSPEPEPAARSGKRRPTTPQDARK